jgi:hypothetical protein
MILRRRSAPVPLIVAFVLVAAVPLAHGGQAPIEPVAAATDDAPAADSSCWTSARLPASVRHGRLTDSFRAGDTSWALGVGSEQRGWRPIALRRSGGRWRDTPVPWRSVSGLMGGDADPRGGTWAVGFVRPGESLRPIAARWRGSRWVEVPVPDPPGSAATLADAEVLPSGRVFAVGARLESGRTRAFALRWANGRWQRVEPALDASESGLAAVTSDATGNVWAAGWHTLRGVLRPLVVRATSSGWERIALGGLPAGQLVLTDIAMRLDTDGYASGYLVAEDGTDHIPFLVRWDGSSWARVDLPWAVDASAILHSVAIGPGGELLLTGARVAGNLGFTRGFLARRTGGTWEVDRLGVNPYQNSEVTDGSYLGARPVVVGAHAVYTMAFNGCVDDRASRDPALGDDPERDSPGSGRRRGAPPLPGPGPDPIVVAEADPAAAVRFVDVAERAGVYEVTETWGGVGADFDADGWPDVFIGRHNRAKPRLLLGGPQGFRPAPKSPYRDRDRHGCAAADVDGDGWVDIFCTHGANRGTNMTSDELWLRPASRRPRQVTADYGLVDPFGRGRAATFIDLDGDPYPDLFMTNEPERADALPPLNRLYRNDRGRRFLSVPGLGLDRSLGGDCATSGDVDGDGDDDLLFCTAQPWRGPAGLRVFRNDAGALTEATRALGLRPIGDQDVAFGDFDGDGDPDDLAQVGTRELRVSIRGADSFTESFSLAMRSGVALGVGDANGDGRDDIYVVRAGTGNQPDMLLLNRRGGRDFGRARIPQARSGVGDDVVALDHDRNGLDDFLVLNGRTSIGPIQLIAAFRGR